MRRKKGFTFMELLVVIAIFGVLVGVVTPAWATYLRRSKFRTQNNKAKAIFNAAQVVVTDLEFAERKFRTELERYKAGETSDQFKDVAKHIYTPIRTDLVGDVDWCYYWDGINGFIADANGNPLETVDYRQDIRNEWNEKLGNSVKRIVTDDMVYKIWVRNYQVQAVTCSAGENNRFIGAHPTNIFMLKGDSTVTAAQIDALENTNVADVNLTWFDLNDSNNGNAITVIGDSDGAGPSDSE